MCVFGEAGRKCMLACYRSLGKKWIPWWSRMDIIPERKSGLFYRAIVSQIYGHYHKMLALYCSPGKDLQIAECEWIQSLIALEKMGCFYTLEFRGNVSGFFFPFWSTKMSIFFAGQHLWSCPASPDIDYWLTIGRHEKIDSLELIEGYNFPIL